MGVIELEGKPVAARRKNLLLSVCEHPIDENLQC